MSKKDELILEAAKDLFCRYGLSKTTVGDIAKAASIGKGTIYLYFASKEEIFFEVFRRLNEQFFNKVEEEVFCGKTAYDQLFNFAMVRSRFVEAQFKLFDNPRDIMIEFTLFVQSNPEILQIMEGYLVREQLVLSKIIEKGIAEDGWEVEDMDFWTRCISNLFHGLDHKYIIDGRENFFMTDEDDVSKLVRFLINGMRRKG